MRAVFSRHFPRVENMAQVKACIRAGRFTDIGGYPLYFVCADGEALSFEAARANLREIASAFNTGAKDWRIVACEINWEDSELTCDHTGEPIPCAYDNESGE